jgi:hypothetical protein
MFSAAVAYHRLIVGICLGLTLSFLALSPGQVRVLTASDLEAVRGAQTKVPCLMRYFTWTCSFIDATGNPNSCAGQPQGNCGGACTYCDSKSWWQPIDFPNDFCDAQAKLNVNDCQLTPKSITCGVERSTNQGIGCHMANNQCQCKTSYPDPLTGNDCQPLNKATIVACNP